MFTEINDKYYLDNHSMTVLMADTVNAYVKPQENEGLEQLAITHIAQMDAEAITECFKRDWARPQDNTDEDLQAMYNTVTEGVTWAAERETERRTAALETQADQAAYRRLLDAVFGDEEDF